MSDCVNVQVFQDTTIYFSDVVATLTQDAATIWITLGGSGRERKPPVVGQTYAIQGDPACINTFGKYVGRSAPGWQFQNVE